MKYVTVVVLILGSALVASCDPITGPDPSEGREIRPALESLRARATDPSLGGGLVLSGLVSAEVTPRLHDVIPIAVEAAAGDREQVRLRRLWDDDDRGLYQVAISLGAGAFVASPEFLSRLREIGAVYVDHHHRFPRNGLYLTAVPYEWARVAVEDWSDVMRTIPLVAARFGAFDPIRRLVWGGLQVNADPPVPGDGILQVQPGETLMVEYVDHRGTRMALPPFAWSFE